MNPFNLNPGSDSLQYLQVASQLLSTRDLIGSKSFATKARESDPNSEGAEQILAIIDTLIAGDKQLSGNHLDWYSILQLAGRTRDSELIALQYKKLGRLLNPNRNKFAFAEHAFKLVMDAWLVLSNPSRKFQFDNEFGNSNARQYNFIQTHFENSGMQEERNKHLSSEIRKERGKQIDDGGGGGGGSGVHFDFMRDGSGGELNSGSSMQFVQGFGQQEIPFFGEDQSLNQQLHWSNQGKQQQLLVRPQPQQPVRSQSQMQQTWFQQPEEDQTLIQHTMPQSQPSHWAQPQPNKTLPVSREQSTQPLHWAQNVPQHLPMSQAQPQSWMQQALPRPHVQQSLTELLIETRPPPESPEEQPQQPLYLSQPVPKQPLHSPQTLPWPLPASQEQSQQPLLSSQPVPQPQPQPPPLSQPQSWMHQSLPSPQVQTSLPEPQSQPEKTPPAPLETQEGVNNGEQLNLGENGNNDDNRDHINVNVEELPNFWTVCPYCFTMHEYPGIYADCALRCQNCKKVFHAAKAEAPPAVADGEDAYLFCWGYFPIGVSLSYLEKRNAEASSWQPFSKMFVVPRGGNTPPSPQGGPEFAFPQKGNTKKRKAPRNTGPRIYIDDDEEEDTFDDISSNDDSDDEDWRYAPMNKKTRSYKRKVATAIKVKQPQVSAEMVHDSNTWTFKSEVLAQGGSSVSVPDAAVQIEAEVAVPSVPVPRAAIDNADKNAVDSSNKKVFVPIRKQPSRVAKDLGKLGGVVAPGGSGVGVPELTDISLSPINQLKDFGQPDGVDGVMAQEGSGVSVPEAAEVYDPTRVANDLEMDGVDGVVAQGVSAVSMPDVAAGSVPARKQLGRVAKDLGKLDEVGIQEGSRVIVPDSPVVSVTPRKQPGRAAKVKSV